MARPGAIGSCRKWSTQGPKRGRRSPLVPGDWPGRWLKQIQLTFIGGWTTQSGSIQGVPCQVQSRFGARLPEPLLEKIGEYSAAFHPDPEIGVVDPSAAHLLEQVHDMGFFQRMVGCQPFA